MKDRLKSRIYLKTKLSYVLFEDIKNHHGDAWAKKFGKLIYGSTGTIIPANDSSHNLPTVQFGIYSWDYHRFADQIDFKKPTYFD